MRVLLIIISGAVLFGIIAVILGLFVPAPDFRGRERLSGIEVGPFNWYETPLVEVVDDLNNQIGLHRKTNDGVYLDPDLDIETLHSVTLKLERTSASEVVRYVGAVSFLFVYSVPEGLVLDHYHQDHRSLWLKYKDWIRHTVLRRWFGRMW